MASGERRRGEVRMVRCPPGDAEPAGLEGLEARLLLATTFTDANVAGPWAVAGWHEYGAIVSNGAGAITSGALTDATGAQAQVINGDYAVLPDGQVIGQLHTSDLANPTLWSMGRLNAGADVLAVNDTVLPAAAGDDAGLMLLLAHHQVYAPADLARLWAGAWAVAGAHGRGMLTVAANGAITGGAYTSATGATASLSGNVSLAGDATATLRTAYPRQAAVSHPYTWAMNAAHDVVALNVTDGAPGAPDAGLTLLVRHAGAFSNADLLGDWNVSAVQWRGTASFDGLGHVTAGNFLDAAGSSGTLTGTYTVTATGLVTMTLAAATVADTQTLQLTGALNTSKNLLALNRAAAAPSASDAGLTVLVRSQPLVPNLAAALGAIALPATLVPGDPGTVVVHLTNTGGLSVAGPVTVKVYASEDAQLNIGAGDREIGTLTLPLLLRAVSGSANVPVRVAIPSDLSPANYYLIAAVDPANAIAESDELDNVAVSPSTRPLVRQFGQVGTRAGLRLVRTDPDGTRVIFTLLGPGTGELFESTVKGVVNWDLHLAGTTLASTFVVTVVPTATPGDDGQVRLHGLTVGDPARLSDQTSLGMLLAPHTDLKGKLIVTGALRWAQLSDVHAGSSLEIGASAAAPATTLTLTASEVKDATLTSAIPIAALTIKDWLNTDSTADVLQAPSIGLLRVKGDQTTKSGVPIAGDFQADLTLNEGGAAGALALGQARIAGGLSGGALPASAWDITGQVGTVTVSGAVDGWDLAATGAIAMLYLPGGVAQADVTCGGDLGPVWAARWAGGSIVAGRLAQLLVYGAPGLRGDFGADLTLRGPAGAAPTLGSATVAGQVTRGAWTITGNTGALALGRVPGGWAATVTGEIASLASAGLNNVSLTALAVRALVVTGDVTLGQITVQRGVDPLRPALGTLRVGGVVADTTLRSAGNVGAISVGALDRSRILVGAADGLFLPAAADQFTTHAALGSFTLGGVPGRPTAWTSSTLAAWALGAVSLAGGVQTTDPDLTLFGLAGHSLWRYIRARRGAPPVTQANRTGPLTVEAVDQYLVQLV